ncbi:hypothetical protein JOC95_002284 [Bacillus tianshenii]|uniref:Aminoglycoside phosphotransferase domain-containing protein n=1 Tax=Sutcliffiella tianshenii TaxID=1463404 RepID=A0ABS2P0E3_9BACI|nr:hypothetical protein [Bacillus tianshenii]MBM7620431.1 hypothetical protein [Bacillus tianshenii]
MNPTLTGRILMMKLENSYFKDDFMRNRLFFRLFQDKRIQSCTQIKENLYKVQTDEGTFILKGMGEFQSAQSSIVLNQLLKENGFINGMEYMELPNGLFYMFEGQLVWTMTRYIPSKRPFSFLREEDRLDGVEVLKSFHQHSAELIPVLSSFLKREKLLVKWKARVEKFEQNLPILTQWFNPAAISEIVYYSRASLEQLKMADLTMKKSLEVVLHGDVASHNFVKSTDNKTYLIDYDLVSIGRSEWDDVQYASRILPFIKWDKKKFFQIPLFQHYFKHPWFWIALTFPMDILREGNQFSETVHNHTMPKSFTNLSFFISSWNLRKQFLTNYNNMIQ